MKLTADKVEFIKARAAGYSLRSTAEKIGISKATAEKWDHDLSAEIGQARQAELEELAETYHLTKQARLEALGETLERIKHAVDISSLSKVPADRLIALYLRTLKEAIREAAPMPDRISATDPEALQEALLDLVNRARSGELSPDQGNVEARAIQAAATVYETSVLQKKVDRLESILTEIQQERGVK